MGRHDDDNFFSRLADELAPRLAAELRGVAMWVDQRESPLGRNTHCAVVRRRISETPEDAEPDAIIAPGGRYLLSPRALREELRGTMPKPGMHKALPDPDAAPDSTRAHLARLESKLRGLR